MKMLYLHANNPVNKKASSIQVLEMCNAFNKIGIDITLAVPKSNSNQTTIQKIIKDELGKDPKFKVLEYKKISINDRLDSIGTYFGIKALLNKINKNDYIFYTRNPFILNTALNAGARVIFEVHSDYLHLIKPLNFIYKKFFLRNVKSKNLLRFVAISNALANVWEKEGVPANKIIVCHDGVSFEDYNIVKSQKEARTSIALNIDKNKKLVVYVGSLYKDREIENILSLAKTFMETIFMVVGGPEKQKDYYCKKASQDNIKNIIFTGRVTHHKVKDYLFSADVLIMIWGKDVPTINICSPLKVFEYMAAERIIVGHGFPTIKEVLKDGETAFLADPCFYKNLEEKLKLAITMEYQNSMTKKAREIVINEYSWEKRAEKIIKDLQL